MNKASVIIFFKLEIHCKKKKIIVPKPFFFVFSSLGPPMGQQKTHITHMNEQPGGCAFPLLCLQPCAVCLACFSLLMWAFRCPGCCGLGHRRGAAPQPASSS